MQVQKNIRLLIWFNFFYKFELYAPISLLYFAVITHSVALSAGIFSITQIADSVFEIPTGYYSDKIGRKNFMLLGSVANLVSIVFYAIGHSFWILAIGSIFNGLANASVTGNNDALLYESLAETGELKQLHSYYGKVNATLDLPL